MRPPPRMPQAWFSIAVKPGAQHGLPRLDGGPAPRRASVGSSCSTRAVTPRMQRRSNKPSSRAAIARRPASLFAQDLDPHHQCPAKGWTTYGTAGRSKKGLFHQGVRCLSSELERDRRLRSVSAGASGRRPRCAAKKRRVLNQAAAAEPDSTRRWPHGRLPWRWVWRKAKA